MRPYFTLTIVLLGLGGVAYAQQGSCPAGQTTSISGTVYAPNGTDPLPNVTVYIPNAPVEAFAPGVSCPQVGAPPSGVVVGGTPAAIGTTTDVNGHFTLLDIPSSSNIQIVAVSGRWRVIGTVDTTDAACGTTVHNMNMPQNHNQGDIPLIAIATGAADQVECVLLKMGISQSEFTDPGGSGRINLFNDGTNVDGINRGGGVTLDGGTPTQDSLMSDSTTLNSYDVLMLPCEGGNYAKPATELGNLIGFANAGGRIYTSHYGYAWMYQNPPYDGVADWSINRGDPPDGPATVNTSFTDGQTLATWLQNIGASISPGQMELNTLRLDQTGVIAPTQSWLTLNQSNGGVASPVMQFVFDTPIGATNQCGRVLYNEYHVENPPSGTVLTGTVFPNECNIGAAMTPQEKLLEYMLFELTSEGGQPTLAPAMEDFGQEAVSLSSAAQTFTWTNNSSFVLQVSSATITGANAGDFSVISNNCTSAPVAGGASCTIQVVFTPSLLGAESATLNVVSPANTLTATLSGTGTPGYSFSPSPASLSFASLDVGASATQSLTLTSLASGVLPVPVFATTGEFAVSTAACGSTLAAGASCPVQVSFLPTTTGPQNGTVGVNSTSLLYRGLNASLIGNGIDFTITLNPTGGTVVAGDGMTTTATLTPLAGFNAPLSLSCPVVTGAGGAPPTCGLSTATVVTGASATAVVSFSTTSQYTVVGYGGFGSGFLWLVAAASGWLLWRGRRSGRALLRGGVLTVLLAAMGLWLTGCTGKLPAQNAAWTAPGNYAVTVTATDGFLVHSATYSLTVTAK